MSGLPKEIASQPRALPKRAPSPLWPLIAFAVALALGALFGLEGVRKMFDAVAERRFDRDAIVGTGAAIGGIIALLVGLGISYWTVRTRNLLAHGKATAGRVLWSKMKDAGILCVHYEFSNDAGTRFEKNHFIGTAWIDEMGFVPGEGDTAYVVYDPKSPRRFAIYGFARGERAQEERAVRQRVADRRRTVSEPPLTKDEPVGH